MLLPLICLALIGVVSAQDRSICEQPQVVGRCRASITRYWYNSRSGQCEQFTYGGCGANANNFLSRQACQRACPGNSAGGNRGRDRQDLQQQQQQQQTNSAVREKDPDFEPAEIDDSYTCNELNGAYEDEWAAHREEAKFILCSNGTPWVLRCADGTVWNDVCKYCDFDFNVQANERCYPWEEEINVIPPPRRPIQFSETHVVPCGVDDGTGEVEIC